MTGRIRFAGFISKLLLVFIMSKKAHASPSSLFWGAVGIKGLVPSAFEKALKLALFLERAKPALRIPLAKRFVSRTLPRHKNRFFDSLGQSPQGLILLHFLICRIVYVQSLYKLDFRIFLHEIVQGVLVGE